MAHQTVCMRAASGAAVRLRARSDAQGPAARSSGAQPHVSAPRTVGGAALHARSLRGGAAAAALGLSAGAADLSAASALAPSRWFAQAAAAAPRRVRARAAAPRAAASLSVAAAAAAPPCNVLVVGGGGREHALCWRLRRSASCADLFCAPGNAGIAREAGVTCVPAASLRVEDHAAVVAFCAAKRIDLVVVGPEAPLVAGLADALRAAGVLVCGPSASAARLEGSKAFMKDVCAKHGIPTASYAVFTDADAAKAHIAARGAPIVVKADGLAAGKGVVVASSTAEACEAVDAMLLRNAFGAAGARVVIEDILLGEEASFFALVGADGVAVPFVACQDHKAVGEGDTGPNTGGMGAYSPAPVVTPALVDEVMATIVNPTVAAMAAEGAPFSGILFAGLMVSPAGKPQLLEFNVRLGDPETQVLMARMRGDLAALLRGAAAGHTAAAAADNLSWSDDAACCVVLAARGYPGDFARGEVIAGFDAAAAAGAVVFHAGTAADAAGNVVSAGGRVLGVTGTGADTGAAAAAAYAGVDALRWPGGFCRRDIGWRAIARERAKR
jgi:phosphoribosylamine--glycine ligase